MTNKKTTAKHETTKAYDESGSERMAGALRVRFGGAIESIHSEPDGSKVPIVMVSFRLENTSENEVSFSPTSVQVSTASGEIGELESRFCKCGDGVIPMLKTLVCGMGFKFSRPPTELKIRVDGDGESASLRVKVQSVLSSATESLAMFRAAIHDTERESVEKLAHAEAEVQRARDELRASGTLEAAKALAHAEATKKTLADWYESRLVELRAQAEFEDQRIPGLKFRAEANKRVMDARARFDALPGAYDTLRALLSAVRAVDFGLPPEPLGDGVAPLLGGAVLELLPEGDPLRELWNVARAPVKNSYGVSHSPHAPLHEAVKRFWASPIPEAYALHPHVTDLDDDAALQFLADAAATVRALADRVRNAIEDTERRRARREWAAIDRRNAAEAEAQKAEHAKIQQDRAALRAAYDEAQLSRESITQAQEG